MLDYISLIVWSIMNIGTQHKTLRHQLSTYKYSSHRDSRNCLIWLGVRLQTKAPCLSERPSVFTSVSAFCTPYHGKKHVLWLEMNSNTLCMRMSPVIRIYAVNLDAITYTLHALKSSPFLHSIISTTLQVLRDLHHKSNVIG